MSEYRVVEETLVSGGKKYCVQLYCPPRNLDDNGRWIHVTTCSSQAHAIGKCKEFMSLEVVTTKVVYP